VWELSIYEEMMPTPKLVTTIVYKQKHLSTLTPPRIGCPGTRIRFERAALLRSSG